MLAAILTFAACAAGASTAASNAVDDSGVVTDACFADEPTIEVGTGETTFEPLEEGDTVFMQHGAQGGEHILGSIRAWHTDEILTVHYTIIKQVDLSVISNQTVRVSAIPEADCAHMYPGMYGYLGFTSEYTTSLMNTRVVLQMDVTDSAGRHGYDEVGIVIGYTPPVDPPK